MGARVTYLADSHTRHRVVVDGQSALFVGGQTLTVSNTIGEAAKLRSDASPVPIFLVEFIGDPDPAPVVVPVAPAKEESKAVDLMPADVETVAEPPKIQNGLFKKNRKRRKDGANN